MLNIILLLCLTLPASADSLEGYPGWSLRELQEEDGTYSAWQGAATLQPPDHRPAVTIKAHLVERLRQGWIGPEQAYAQASPSTAGRGKKEEDAQANEPPTADRNDADSRSLATEPSGSGPQVLGEKQASPAAPPQGQPPGNPAFPLGKKFELPLARLSCGEVKAGAAATLASSSQAGSQGYLHGDELLGYYQRYVRCVQKHCSLKIVRDPENACHELYPLTPAVLEGRSTVTAWYEEKPQNLPNRHRPPSGQPKECLYQDPTSGFQPSTAFCARSEALWDLENQSTPEDPPHSLNVSHLWRWEGKFADYFALFLPPECSQIECGARQFQDEAFQCFQRAKPNLPPTCRAVVERMEEKIALKEECKGYLRHSCEIQGFGKAGPVCVHHSRAFFLDHCEAARKELLPPRNWRDRYINFQKSF